jgi:hypothetical protein
LLIIRYLLALIVFREILVVIKMILFTLNQDHKLFYKILSHANAFFIENIVDIMQMSAFAWLFWA